MELVDGKQYLFPVLVRSIGVGDGCRAANRGGAFAIRVTQAKAPGLGMGLG